MTIQYSITGSIIGSEWKEHCCYLCQFLIISESVWISKGNCVWHKYFNAYDWATHLGPYLCSSREYVHPWKPHLRGQKVADTAHILLLQQPAWNLVNLITIYYKVPQLKCQAIIACGVFTLINLVNNQNTQDIYLCSRPPRNICEIRGKSTNGGQHLMCSYLNRHCGKLSVLVEQIGTSKEGKFVLGTTLLCKTILFKNLFHSSWGFRKLTICPFFFNLSSSASQILPSLHSSLFLKRVTVLPRNCHCIWSPLFVLKTQDKRYEVFPRGQIVSIMGERWL